MKQTAKQPTPEIMDGTLTVREQQRCFACAAVWSFEEMLDLLEDYRKQKLSLLNLVTQVKARRDLFKATDATVRAIRPQMAAEYIPSANLFYSDNGNKTRLDKCAAILKDNQLAEHWGAIKVAQVKLLSKEPVPVDLDNRITTLYRICRD